MGRDHGAHGDGRRQEQQGGSAWSSMVRAVAINRGFGLFSLGAFPSALAGWMQNVALGWAVVSAGGSSLWLGVLSLTSMGPLVLAPLGGALADRVERRLLILAGSIVQAVAAVALAELAIAGHLTLAALLVLALLTGLPNAVMWPAWSAFITDLVMPRDLRRAVAINSARFNLTRVLGPALAGALLTRGGPGVCLAAAAACSGSLVATLLFVRPAYARPRAAAAPWRAALAEAVRFATRAPLVRAQLLSAGMLGLLALPYAALLPGFAQGVLHGGPQALGWLLTSGGVGAVGGAILSGSRLAASRPRVVAGVLHLATSLGVAGLALAPTLPWACLATAEIGLASIAYLAVANGTLQLNTPPEMVGRLLGLWVVVNSGTVPVGGLVLGALASGAGLRPVVLGAGLVSAAGALALLAGGAHTGQAAAVTRPPSRYPASDDAAPVPARGRRER